jgi:hypothetical protein
VRNSRVILLVALLLLVIFFLFTRERTRPFIGHHDWDNVTWVNAAENYQRYGLWDARLQQIRNVQPAPPEEWIVYQNHPPGISLITLATIESFGNTEFTARLAPIFASLVTVALLFALVQRYSDSSTAMLSIAFFGLSPILIYFSGKIGHEQFTLLLVLLFLNLHQRRPQRLSALWSIAVGILGFIGAFIGWGWYLFVGFFFLFQWWKARIQGFRRYLGLWVGTGLGGISLLVLSIVQQPDFLQTLLDAFLIRTTNTDNAEPITATAWFIQMGSRLLWLATPVVPLFTLVVGYLAWRRRDKANADGLSVLFVAGGTFALLFWQGSYIHSYYLYYIFAPLSAWAAMGFMYVLYAYGSPPKLLWRSVLTLMLLAFLGGSYQWGTELFAHDLNEQRYSWGIQVAERTDPDERVISNIPPQGPHIGYYARRVVIYDVSEEEFLETPRPENWGFYIYCTGDDMPDWVNEFSFTYDEETHCYFIDLHSEDDDQ